MGLASELQVRQETLSQTIMQSEKNTYGGSFQEDPINVGVGQGFQEASKITLLISKNQSLSSCLYPYSSRICLSPSCYAFHYGNYNYWAVITKETALVYVTSSSKTLLLCCSSPTYRRPICSSTTTSTILFSSQKMMPRRTSVFG